jgi:hypothetical protein
VVFASFALLDNDVVDDDDDDVVDSDVGRAVDLVAKNARHAVKESNILTE